MKWSLLIFIHAVCAIVLLAAACSSHKVPANLPGIWHSKTNAHLLKITDKQFAMDSPEPEDYFVKGDTIYTSFEGNLPYSKYVIKQLDEHRLVLFTPDSTTAEYTR